MCSKLNRSSLIPVLLRFLVRLVLAATVTKLLELQTARGRLLVLRRRVIPFLALSALQCHNFPHLLILTEFQLTDYREQPTDLTPSLSVVTLSSVDCRLSSVVCRLLLDFFC